VGIALLFPADKPIAPIAVGGDRRTGRRAVRRGHERGRAIAWEFKDALPAASLAWSGKFLQRAQRAAGTGPARVAVSGRRAPRRPPVIHLTQEAHRIAEALLFGPQPTSMLRETDRPQRTYDRAIKELHRFLLITSSGTAKQNSAGPRSFST
jgi:hypothetical protein